MNIPIYFYVILVSILELSLMQVSNIQSQPNVDPIEMGKQIYTTGIGHSNKKIMAVISGRELPASMMACSNCHGKCGKGLSLQGVLVPDIRMDNHIERYAIDDSTEKGVKLLKSKMKRSISMGLKFDNGEIHNMMPRYKMSLDDMNYLLAYLAVLGEEKDCVEN